MKIRYFGDGRYFLIDSKHNDFDDSIAEISFGDVTKKDELKYIKAFKEALKKMNKK